MMIGLFNITRYEAVFNGFGEIERSTALTVDCGICHATSSSGDQTLAHLPGGTLIRWEHCGTHKAVSNAKIAEWDRLALARI